MKKLLVLFMCLLVAVSMSFVMTGCGDDVEGVYIRTKKETSYYTVTYTLSLSDGKITHRITLYDLKTDGYSYGDSSYGSYVLDDNMVYVTWDDGDKDRYIFNDTEGSLTHSVEDWVFYRE